MVYEAWFCANLQGNVFALVPDTLQQPRLAVVKFQQLCPHRVIDVKKVVGVCSGILHHLIWQGAVWSSHKTIITSTTKVNISRKYNKLKYTRGHVTHSFSYRILQSASW